MVWPPQTKGQTVENITNNHTRVAAILWFVATNKMAALQIRVSAVGGAYGVVGGKRARVIRRPFEHI